MTRMSLLTAVAILASCEGPAVAAENPSDAQIAHIAYTAGTIDIAAARQTLQRSSNIVVTVDKLNLVRSLPGSGPVT